MDFDFYHKQKRFKRLKQIQVEDSDGEQEVDEGMERDTIANQLFDGDDVSISFELLNVIYVSLLNWFFFCYFIVNHNADTYITHYII